MTAWVLFHSPYSSGKGVCSSVLSLVMVMPVAARCQNVVHLIGNLLAGESAVCAAGQELIVIGVLVADCGDHGQDECGFVEAAACGGSANGSAPSHGSVFGNSSSLTRRATGKQSGDLTSHSGDQLAILLAALDGSAGS